MFCSSFNFKTKRSFLIAAVSSAVNSTKYSNIYLPKTFFITSKKFKKQFEPLPASIKNKILNEILSSEISEYLNESKLLQLRPYLIFKKSILINYIFITDCKVAKDIVGKFSSHIKTNQNIILEINPGLGILTYNLIKHNFLKIHLLEKFNKIKDLSLNQILEKYPGSSKVIETKTESGINFPIDEIQPFLKTGSSIKFVGVIANYSFFNQLLYFAITKILWNNLHLMEFYVLISLDVYQKIKGVNFQNISYCSYSLFNLIFETEIMGEYPRESFLPLSILDNDKMFLVKISKRPNSFVFDKKDELSEFVFFLKIIGKTRFNFVITTLEKWIPNCGPYLLSKGISMTTQTRDILPDEAVKLFAVIKKCAGYGNFKKLTASFSTHDDFE